MTRFEVGIPGQDSTNNQVNFSSLQTNMESIASDAMTHNIGQDTIWKAESYQIQMNNFCWFIPDTDVTQANTYFSNFIGGYTFSVTPYAHSWSIA